MHVSLLKCLRRNSLNTKFPFAKSSFPIGLQPFSLKTLPPFVRKTTDFPVSMKPIHLKPMKKQIPLWRFCRFTCSRACPHGQPWKLKSRSELREKVYHTCGISTYVLTWLAQYFSIALDTVSKVRYGSKNHELFMFEWRFLQTWV